MLSKKKISIITLHRVFNYGSVFQAYATQKIFSGRGCDVQIIDYITEQRTTSKLLFSIPSTFSKNPIKRLFYIGAKMISIMIKKFRFGSFLKNHLNLTQKKYTSFDDLKRNPPNADIYVSGSDQIWNSDYNEGVDKGFFLVFANGNTKVSFASSFGKTDIDKNEMKITKSYLDDYRWISVREESAIKILRDMGIEATRLVDPTLLLESREWETISSPRLVSEPYLLLMLLYNEDNGATSFARKLADHYKIKLVKLCWDIKKDARVDIMLTHRRPEDFLSLIKNSDYVVTNSFHGIAFSINFNKQFYAFPRDEYNCRIEELLTLTGLETRIVNENEDLIKEEIDYTRVNPILQSERLRASSFLDKVLDKEYE